MTQKVSLLFSVILLTISISSISYSDEFDAEWVSPYNELCDYNNTRLENVKIWHSQNATWHNINTEDRTISNLLKNVGNNTEELLHEVNVVTENWTNRPFIDSDFNYWSYTYGYCVWFEIIQEIHNAPILEIVDHPNDMTYAIDNYTDEQLNVWRVVQIMNFGGPYQGYHGLSHSDPTEKLSVVKWAEGPVVYMHEYGHVALTRLYWTTYWWPTLLSIHYLGINEHLNVMYQDTAGGRDGDLAYKPSTIKFTYNYED